MRARTPAVTPDRVQRIFDGLAVMHPGADTELAFRTPFELLAATILSAQCTDARVNAVTPDLFTRFPDARAMARVEPEILEPIIQPTGFFRMKSRSLVGMARALVDRHGGNVPASMELLVALPGVGRKTANVVLGHALGVPGFPVDRHVLRVAGRIGLIHTDDAELAEAALCAHVPPDRWTVSSDGLILHGRRICKPRPLCDNCLIRQDCDYFRGLGAKAVPRSKPTRSTGATPRKRAPSGRRKKQP